jgi:hypothetical protein
MRGVTKRVNARDENEINNTGFGVGFGVLVFSSSTSLQLYSIY